MKNMMKRSFLILISLFWMGVIFYMSHQNGEESSNVSNKVTKIFLELFYKEYHLLDVSQQLILFENTSYIIRKLSHFIEYFLLGSFFFFLIKEFTKKDSILYSISISLSILYAITDEIHQSFVGGRSPMIKDVLIDALGAISAILCMGIILNSIRIIKKGKKYD